MAAFVEALYGVVYQVLVGGAHEQYSVVARGHDVYVASQGRLAHISVAKLSAR